MNLGEEDLCVLMKILVENIGEGSSQHRIDAKRQMVQGRLIHYADGRPVRALIKVFEGENCCSHPQTRWRLLKSSLRWQNLKMCWLPLMET